jgi:uncharacterized protein YoxC
MNPATIILAAGIVTLFILFLLLLAAGVYVHLAVRAVEDSLDDALSALGKLDMHIDELNQQTWSLRKAFEHFAGNNNNNVIPLLKGAPDPT